MPGLLYHSPAQIVRELLVNTGYGINGDDVLPTSKGTWPIYVGREPDKPDQIIKISNTVGRDFGTTQIDGELQEHQGIQIMVRSATEQVGYLKIHRIALFLNQLKQILVDMTQIESEGTGTIDYQIYSIDVVGNVLPLGNETPTSKRQLFTLNALVSIRRCC